MPITHSEDDLPRIVRRVNVRYGRAMIHLRCAVRLDYGRANTEACIDGKDVCFARRASPACACRAPNRCTLKVIAQWPNSS